MRVRTVQVNTQQDAKEVTWLGPARLFSRNPSRNNLAAMAQADAALSFDVSVVQAPTSKVTLAMGCGETCGGEIDLTEALTSTGTGQKRTIKAPLKCFAARGADMAAIDTPFAIEADAPFAAAFANIRIVAGAAKDADALKCD